MTTAVSLSKGDRISLNKTAGKTLNTVRLGLGWDAASGLFGLGGGSIDLDASALLLDSTGRLIDAVYFGSLRAQSGAVQHSGDNLTGAGDGDDESITVQLDKLSHGVQYIFFTVNSYRGQTFDKVKNAHVRLLDANTNTEVAKYNLSAKGSHTGMIMAKLYRHNDEWKLQAIGEQANGRTYQDLLPAVQALI